MVVTVPSALVVEGHDEEIGRDQPIEEDGSVVASADLGAQLSVEGIEHGRVDEEIDELRFQVIEHLAQQEIADASIGPREGLQKSASIGAALQRECRQLRPRRPTFGEVVEHLQFRRFERQALETGELGRLRSGESEIVAAQFEQPAVDAKSGQRHRKVGSAPEHESKVVGEGIHERRQHRRRRLGEVQVIDHDHARRVDRRKLVRDRDRRVVCS